MLDNLTVYDNVAIALKMIGLKDKEEIQKRVNYVLECVKMYRYRNRPAKMLSGGERQRVAIARAIVKNPNIVIADEPTGNLDSQNSIEIMNIIKAISKERLVVLVTHETELAKNYASRIVEIQNGKIIKDYQNDTDTTEIKDYSYDLNSVINPKFKVKYKSINGFVKSFYMGIKKIANYSVLKIVLLTRFLLISNVRCLFNNKHKRCFND